MILFAIHVTLNLQKQIRTILKYNLQEKVAEQPKRNLN